MKLYHLKRIGEEKVFADEYLLRKDKNKTHFNNSSVTLFSFRSGLQLPESIIVMA